MLSASRSFLAMQPSRLLLGYREGAQATRMLRVLSTATLANRKYSSSLRGHHNPATRAPHSRPNRRRQWARDKNQEGFV
jgi:hypothetical protein